VNGRPIIFGPGDKLRWLEAIVTAHGTAPFDAAVGIAITNRIDKYTATAVIGQDWIARFAGGAARTVREAITRMKRLDLLDVQVSRGRGRANVYRPKIPGENGRAAANIREENRQITTGKLADYDRKTGGHPPPLPNNYLNSSSPADLTRNQNEANWLSVRQGLAATLGHDVEAAWFGHLELEAITLVEVVMRAPSKFIRKSIEARYPDKLLHQWQRLRPLIVSVRLVDPTGGGRE
jgi:hypothetical protein